MLENDGVGARSGTSRVPGRQRLVALEELGVLAGEDVVGHDPQADGVAEGAAEGKEERDDSA